MNTLVFQYSVRVSLKLITLLVLLGLGGTFAHGQAVDLPTGKGDKKASRWDEAKKNIDRIQVNRVAGDKRVVLKLVEEPVFSFVDAVDANSDGTIWLWGQTGRPSVALQVWTDTPPPPTRYYTFTSLLTSRSVSLDRVEGIGVAGSVGSVRWTPREAGIEFKTFSKSPKPSSKETIRLIQMKSLARRFKTHEVLRGQRFQLRLMPKSVHRYSDSQSGLVDGAVFLMARGTDPEILLLLELVENKAGTRKWQYAFARVSHAEVHASLEGKEVWTAPEAGTQPAHTLNYAQYGERLRSTAVRILP